MGYLKSGLISLAAAAAFLVIDTTVLSLAPTYKWAGACAVFVLSALLIWILPSKERHENGKGGNVLSGNVSASDTKMKVEDSKLRPKKDANILSGNKSGGKIEIEVKNTRT